MDGAPDDAVKVPGKVGDRLRAARLARGLDLAEVATRTRVPQRHLEAIEASNYSGLPSITYAMGFAKAYARAVGEDEVAIARDLRAELSHSSFDRAPPTPVYETSDPSRVPSRGLVVVAALVAIVLLVGAGLWYGTAWFRNATPPADTAPLIEPTPTPAPSAAPAAAPAPAASGGQVTLTANDTVWLRIYDANNDTLVMKTMQPGERYDVPPGANGPMINVGRPDKLSITVNGAAIPPLGTGKRPIKDVSLAPDALRARLNAAGSATPGSDGTGNSGANP